MRWGCSGGVKLKFGLEIHWDGGGGEEVLEFRGGGVDCCWGTCWGTVPLRYFVELNVGDK